MNLPELVIMGIHVGALVYSLTRSSLESGFTSVEEFNPGQALQVGTTVPDRIFRPHKVVAQSP